MWAAQQAQYSQQILQWPGQIPRISGEITDTKVTAIKPGETAAEDEEANIKRISGNIPANEATHFQVQVSIVWKLETKW